MRGRFTVCDVEQSMLALSSSFHHSDFQIVSPRSAFGLIEYLECSVRLGITSEAWRVPAREKANHVLGQTRSLLEKDQWIDYTIRRKESRKRISSTSSKIVQHRSKKACESLWRRSVSSIMLCRDLEHRRTLSAHLCSRHR
jgi:hypothetical protein